MADAAGSALPFGLGNDVPYDVAVTLENTAKDFQNDYFGGSSFNGAGDTLGTDPVTDARWRSTTGSSPWVSGGQFQDANTIRATWPQSVNTGETYMDLTDGTSASHRGDSSFTVGGLTYTYYPAAGQEFQAGSEWSFTFDGAVAVIIPEPSGALLLLVGFTGIVLFRRH